MNLYLKQKVFSWSDRFTVYDEFGNDRYYVDGEIFTFGKKLHLLGIDGNEVAFIYQKLFSFLPKYYISMNGFEVGEVVREFTLFKQEYTVNGLGWRVYGDFFDHEYAIYCGDDTVASVTKKWFSWGDTYSINIADGVDEAIALAVVLVIDACIETENNY